ncbi:MAG TPA: TetR/AcrR family transcriptional regulator [Elainellaceae cyanobacterium]
MQPELNSPDRSKLPKKASKILDAATQEFLKHGYAGATIDQIAATAGVSKPTVYSHFRNKEELFSVLIEQLAKEKYRTVFNVDDPQALQAEPRAVLRRVLTNFFDVAGGDPDFVAFMRLIIGESGRFPEIAQPYLRNIAKPGLETMSQYLMSSPELNLTDPEATARIMIGSVVYYFLLQEVLHGKSVIPLERDRIIDNLIELILNAERQNHPG